MVVLTFHDVSKSFGDKTVLSNVSFFLQAGEKAALVGANGAGKSTILKIARGELEIDHGEVKRLPHAEIGYLPQLLIAEREQQTIEELIHESQQELRRLEERLNELTRMMQELPTQEVEALLLEYGELQERFDRRGGYEMEHLTAYVLQGLGLSHLPKHRQIASLSGGEKTRVGLAALLISAPDILLLDEPTNHLDTAALLWLETYLQDYSGALLFSSHDRRFLSRTANKILEMDDHSHELRVYPGSYEHYLVTKQKERERWEEEYQRQQEEIKQLKLKIKERAYRVAHNRGSKDNDKFIHHFLGERVQQTISRNIRAAEKELERILADPIPRPPEPLQFRAEFTPDQTTAKTVLVASEIGMQTSDGRQLFSSIGLTVDQESRILIQGANGAGKTTLLNILAGQVAPDTGSVQIAPGITIGYFEQEYDLPDPKQTLLAAYRDGRVGYEQEHIAELLSYGLFRYDDLMRPIGAISPGQYRKLLLARLLASRANLLLIDEPTNHLSLDVVEEVETALARFPGPIIAVSHDRWFCERFNGSTWLLENGKLVPQG